MTPKIPDAETRKRLVAQLRESNRKLDIFNLSLDELIAKLEAGIREQHRARLGIKKKESRSA